MPVKGQPSAIFKKMFSHSSESWAQMWEDETFKKGQAKVNASKTREGLKKQVSRSVGVVVSSRWEDVRRQERCVGERSGGAQRSRTDVGVGGQWEDLV